MPVQLERHLCGLLMLRALLASAACHDATVDANYLTISSTLTTPPAANVYAVVSTPGRTTPSVSVRSCSR